MKKKEEPVYVMFDAKRKLFIAPLGHTTQAAYGKKFTAKEAERFLRKPTGRYEKILVQEWEEEK